VSETTTQRRCHGYCGLPIPPDKPTTYTVIEPSGRLLEFCDSDCLQAYYQQAQEAAEDRIVRLGLRLRVDDTPAGGAE
jgi:hypothetical protein